MEAIDITPTWGEWGNVFLRLAQSNEQAALTQMLPDAKKCFAAAEAAKTLLPTLTDEQRAAFNALVSAELQKLGHSG